MSPVPRATASAPSSTEGVPARALTATLHYEPPLAWTELLAFLAGRGAAGVESVADGAYRRTVRLGDATGWIAVSKPRSERAVLSVRMSASLRDVRAPLLERLRALFDLDMQPARVSAVLARDPRLQRSVQALPGLRVPGAFDGFELVLRAILGQQVTVKAATTLFSRFAARFGEPIATPYAALTHLSPRAASIAVVDVQTLIDLGLTERRARTIQEVARCQVQGRLDFEPGASAAATLAAFLAIPGIGEWTANYVAMRALRERDAFPHGDLALCKALGGVAPREAGALSEAWRPWRAYAALHLWHGLNSGGGG